MKGITIKAAAALSGLSTHTLRAWERRYLVVQPVRTDKGRRAYSNADIDKLKLLALLTARGHAISAISSMGIEALEELAAAQARDEGPASKPQENAPEFLRSLLGALQAFDLDEIERQLLKARISMPTRQLILDVVSPLFSQVGKRVAEGELNVAQEHILSALLRTHLGELLNQTQKVAERIVSRKEPRPPRFVFATPEGDLHEFGILLAAILSGIYGFRFLYLGSNLPVESLSVAARVFEADFIVLGSVDAGPARFKQPLKKYVLQLSKRLSERDVQNTTICVGGFCDFDAKLIKQAHSILHLKTLSDFDIYLEGLLLHFSRTRRKA